MITGDSLREIRQQLQLNQQKMAQLLGVAKVTVNQLEGKSHLGPDDHPVVVNTILALGRLERQARVGGDAFAAEQINRILEKLDITQRLAPGIGFIAVSSALGALTSGIIEALSHSPEPTASDGSYAEKLRKTMEWLDGFDHDGSEQLDFEELKAGLGWEDEEEVRTLFNHLDLNGDGYLTVGELMDAKLKRPVWEALHGVRRLKDVDFKG